jgi:hypothetical protein
MNQKLLRDAVDLARRDGKILVATADGGGLPHLASAGGLELLPDGRLGITAWFCPGTLENIQGNRGISLTVWDPAQDRGHQILGEVERVEELAVMDGYAPGREDFGTIPQVERRIVVQPRRALIFTRAPHSDRDE